MKKRKNGKKWKIQILSLDAIGIDAKMATKKWQEIIGFSVGFAGIKNLN